MRQRLLVARARWQVPESRIGGTTRALRCTIGRRVDAVGMMLDWRDIVVIWVTPVSEVSIEQVWNGDCGLWHQYFWTQPVR